MRADFAALDWEQYHLQSSRREEWLLPYDGALARALSMSLAGFARSAPLLELGCGTSDLAMRLHNDGWNNVTAVDISAHAVETARRQWGSPSGLRFIRADARRLDAFEPHSFGSVLDKGTLDAICCGEGFDHEAKLVASAVERVLVPGGLWITASLMPPSVVMPLLDRSNWPYTRYEPLDHRVHLYHARRHKRGCGWTKWHWHPVEGGWRAKYANSLF